MLDHILGVTLELWAGKTLERSDFSYCGNLEDNSMSNTGNGDLPCEVSEGNFESPLKTLWWVLNNLN